VLIYAGTNNIFPILTLGSNLGIKGVNCAFFGVFSELLAGVAKILGSKIILLFLEIGLCQSFPLLLKTPFLQFQPCQRISAGAKIGSLNRWALVVCYCS
jgi:hypothetical protein